MYYEFEVADVEMYDVIQIPYKSLKNPHLLKILAIKKFIIILKIVPINYIKVLNSIKII